MDIHLHSYHAVRYICQLLPCYCEVFEDVPQRYGLCECSPNRLIGILDHNAHRLETHMDAHQTSPTGPLSM